MDQLERLLVSAPRPEPSAALRRRVLSTVRSELHRESIFPMWQFAAAFAATLLVGLSLALGALQIARLAPLRRQGPPSVYEVAKRLQQFSPGLSREESLCQAALRCISGDVSCEKTLNEILFDHDFHES